jgi:uncharacterized protein (TIGR03000 family)
MMRRAVLAVAVAALAAWLGGPSARATDWHGPYDNDGGRYYSDETRDYQRLGYDGDGMARFRTSQPYFVSGVYLPGYSPGYSYAAESSEGYYYGALSPSQDNMARIRLVVPTDAKVWFDNKATSQGGRERDFQSPQLVPGREYGYDVKVQWHDANGKDVTRTRHVDVRANANVTVDFTR